LNLERWYERDLRLVRLCHELAPLVNAAHAEAAVRA